MPDTIIYLTNLPSSIVSAFSYPGIIFLMALESALIPIPSELTMTFAGFLSSRGEFNLFLVIAAGTAGNIIGASLSYYLGYAKGEEIINRFIKKYGKFFLLSGNKLEHSKLVFQKYGVWVILIARLLPGARAVISLPAGISKISYIKFILLTLLGSLIWSSILATSGYLLGENWNELRIYSHKFNIALVILSIILIGTYTVIRFHPHLKVKNA